MISGRRLVGFILGVIAFAVRQLDKATDKLDTEVQKELQKRDEAFRAYQNIVGTSINKQNVAEAERKRAINARQKLAEIVG